MPGKPTYTAQPITIKLFDSFLEGFTFANLFLLLISGNWDPVNNGPYDNETTIPACQTKQKGMML